MTRLDDPALVAEEYADEVRLPRGAAAFPRDGKAIDARELVAADVLAAVRELIASAWAPSTFTRANGAETLRRRSDTVFASTK